MLDADSKTCESLEITRKYASYHQSFFVKVRQGALHALCIMSEALYQLQPLFLKQNQKKRGTKAAVVPFSKEPTASCPMTENSRMTALKLLCGTTREDTLFPTTAVLSAKPPFPSETRNWAFRPTGGATTRLAMKP